MGGIRRIQVTPEYVERKLEELERKYEMTSEVFYGRYNRGEVADHPEIMKWAMYFDLAAKLGREGRASVSAGAATFPIRL